MFIYLVGLPEAPDSFAFDRLFLFFPLGCVSVEVRLLMTEL